MKVIKIGIHAFDFNRLQKIFGKPQSYDVLRFWSYIITKSKAVRVNTVIAMPDTVVCKEEELLSVLQVNEIEAVDYILKIFERYGMIKVLNDDIMDYDKNPDIPRGNDYAFDKRNSNKKNGEILLLNKEYEEINDNPILYDAVIGWLEYKDSKKPKQSNHYDTERTLKGFLTRALNNAKEHGVNNVTNVIQYSIDNNYMGVVWDRLNSKTYAVKNRIEEVDSWV